MKEVVVLSGKGGTGKTSLVASFAALAKDKVLVDCDVDAADLHLVLQPQVKEAREFWSGHKAHIDLEKCTRCGLCQGVCRFAAIKENQVDPLSCEGCGFCSHICPEQAITMKENLSGQWFISQTRYGPLVHARLEPAQENSGRLVTVVRHHARLMAEKEKLDYILSDGPPGIGCPVISSLSGADLALLVTEPTPSGRHDLERVLGVCRHFGVPALACINKYDLDEENTRGIEDWCAQQGAPVVSRIPFDEVVTEALIAGLPVVEYSASSVASELRRLWQSISRALNT